MPAKFDRMVKDIKKSLLDKNPKMDEKEAERRAYAIATSRWKKMTGKKPKEGYKVLEYSMPVVVEEVKLKSGKLSEKKMKVKGVAIKATTSRNNVTYEIAELDKAKESLIGKHLKVNHSSDVMNNVGIIEEVERVGDEVHYKGSVFNTSRHPDTIEMLKNGLINQVSIEAILPKDLEEVDGKMIAKDIEFTNLAFVDTAGVPGANVSIAEAFELINEAKLTYKQKKKLPDSAYAYVDGDTRVYPINDPAHIRNALARFAQGKFGGIPPDKRAGVLAKIIRKAKSAGIEVNPKLLKKAGMGESIHSSKSPLETGISSEEMINMEEEKKTKLEALEKQVEELTKKLEEQEEEPKPDKEQSEEEKSEDSKEEGLSKKLKKVMERLEKIEKVKSKGVISEDIETTVDLIKETNKDGTINFSERFPDNSY